MSIYTDFFNFNNPCPESIKDCQELRLQYQEEYNKLNSDGSCGGCQVVNLKAEFHNKIWKAYMELLTTRV